jgi:hypothetical protein
VEFPKRLIERFWSKVHRRGPDECWPWKTPLKEKYPDFEFEGVRYRGHRLALLLTVGALPEGAGHALHSCDNRMCCNPRHLRWGTNAENIKDMVSRHGRFVTPVRPLKTSFRFRKGPFAEGFKLTKDDVLKIRKLLAQGEWQTKIAARFGVHPSLISSIKKGKCWTHV